MKAFFDRIFGRKSDGFLIPVFAKGNSEDDRPSFRFCSNVSQLVVTAKKLAKQKTNVYFGCCPITQRPEKGRGSEADVGLVTCFWADVDIQTPEHKAPKGVGLRNYPKTKETALKLINEFGLKPSIVVDSGNGLHAYWILVEPVKITDENRAEMKQISMAVSNKLRVKAAIHDMCCDQVGDLARIMRIPGTPNVKNDPPKDCTVIASNEDTYSLDQIRENVAKYIDMGTSPKSTKPSSSSKSTIQANAIASDSTDVIEIEMVEPSDNATQGHIPKAVMNLIENDDKFKATWERRRRDLRDTSASGYDQSMTDQLVAAGVKDQTIIDALYAMREKYGDDTKKLYRKISGGGGETYVQKTIRKARENHKTSSLQQKALSDMDEILRSYEGASVVPTSEEEVEKMYGKSSQQIATHRAQQKPTAITPTPDQPVTNQVSQANEEEELPTTEESAVGKSSPTKPKLNNDKLQEALKTGNVSLLNLKPGQSIITGEARIMLLKSIFAMTGLNVIDVLRQGMREPIFYLIDSDQHRIKIGDTATLYARKRFDLTLFEATSKRLPPSCTEEKWARISEAISKCATLIEDLETDPEANAADLMYQYINGRELIRGGSWEEALPDCLPFYVENGSAKPRDPGLYVNVNDIKKFVNESAIAQNERVTGKTIREWLSLMGFKCQRIDKRIGPGKKDNLTRRYWVGIPSEVGIVIED